MTLRQLWPVEAWLHRASRVCALVSGTRTLDRLCAVGYGMESQWSLFGMPQEYPFGLESGEIGGLGLFAQHAVVHWVFGCHSIIASSDSFQPFVPHWFFRGIAPDGLPFGHRGQG